MASQTSRCSYRYRVVDVFTKQPLEGNQLAVFPDAYGLDDGLMQRIAKELNLAETVFLLPAKRSDCAAALRIFTPAREMPFAGHPTIGASFVLRHLGMVAPDTERFTLEEKAGPIRVRVESGECDRPMIWLMTPPISFGKPFDPAQCAAILGLDPGDLLDVPPELVGAGNPAVFIAVRDKAAVDRAAVDARGLAELQGKRRESFFAFVFTPTAAGAYSRMFAPHHGVPEDPATGSATGPLAAYMMRHGLAPRADGSRFVSEQGTKMGRRSLLHILVHGEQGADGIEVGGFVTPVIEAAISF